MKARGSALRAQGLWLAALALAAGAACSSREEPAATSAAPAPARGASGEGGLPHGDHNPHHGGIVLMKGDLHFEVVPDAGGHHRLYFTDAVRAELPAAVAQTVSLTIHRANQPDEVVPMRIDEAGESWEATGRPIERPDTTTVRVAFTLRREEPYWIDVPFRPPAVPAKK